MSLLKFHGLMIWSDVFHWCRWSTCGENKVESQRKSCCINFGKAIQTSGATVTSAVQPLYCVGSFQRRPRLGNGIPLQYSCLENPMDGGAWEAAVHGVAKSQTRLSDFTFTSLSRIGEGNGNPLQCSCLENPRDRGAWWAAVYGVTQSQTRLKRLSSSSSNELFFF